MTIILLSPSSPYCPYTLPDPPPFFFLWERPGPQFALRVVPDGAFASSRSKRLPPRPELAAPVHPEGARGKFLDLQDLRSCVLAEERPVSFRAFRVLLSGFFGSPRGPYKSEQGVF